MWNSTNDSAAALKLDVLAAWIEAEWTPLHLDDDLVTLWAPSCCIDETVLSKFDAAVELAGGLHFAGSTPIECPVVTHVHSYDYDGNLTFRTGAFLYRFAQKDSDEVIEILVLGSHYTDQGWSPICLAAVPRAIIPAWMDFSKECRRLENALEPSDKVIVIGGRSASFVPTVAWDEIILPSRLKTEIMDDVGAFFRKGIEVYKRLNLKPFRKLLLAGVPGTGKTMICSALAKWAIEQGYPVIYVSSAYSNSNDHDGSSFRKIQYALSVAADTGHSTLILLEELDAYLHDEEKALVLNVLDGMESTISEQGMLLVATTNYPEAIDERVLKRPGRLDRIFIVPETRDRQDAEKMLRQYLGSMWRDEHQALVPHLVGYPGAFVREVAVYALTQVAYVDGTALPLELLEQSFKSLKEQIKARDDFLTRRTIAFGSAMESSNGS